MTEPKEEGFPSWRYGPGDAAEIFNSAADVPKGWEDHPGKVAEKPAAAPKPPKAPKAPVDDVAKARKRQVAADLKALGVTFFGGAPLETLEAMLDDATKPKGDA